MSGAALSITTGANDVRWLQPKSTVSSQESASLDEIASKIAGVADSANGLITQAREELQGISGDARGLLANLNDVTGTCNRQKIRAILDNVNDVVATERPKIDRLTDQLNVLSQHADNTIQNVNCTVTDVREAIRKDLGDGEREWFHPSRTRSIRAIRT